MRARTIVQSLGLLCLSHLVGGCAGSGADPVAPPAPPLAPDEPGASTLTLFMSRGCATFEGVPCPLDRPLMSGVHEFVLMRVEGVHRGDEATVTSSDPGVLAVDASTSGVLEGTTYSASFHVTAVRAGSTTLTVTRGGVTLATATVRVADPARLDVVVEQMENPITTERVDRLALRPGTRASIVGVPRDAQGQALYANDGVEWSVPDTSRVNLTWANRSGSRIVDDHVYLEARAPGAEVLTVRAGNLTRSIDVEVR